MIAAAGAAPPRNALVDAVEIAAPLLEAAQTLNRYPLLAALQLNHGGAGGRDLTKLILSPEIQIH